MPLRRARVRRSGVRRLVIGLVVVVILLVAADRITLFVSERAAATAIRNSEHLAKTPSVKILGFPFLTQLIGRTLDDVHVVADNVIAGAQGRTITISQVSASLHHVHLTGLSSGRADTVTGTAVLTYAELGATIGVPIRFGGPTPDGVGRVAATESAVVLGQLVSGTVSAEVAVVAGNIIVFVNPEVSVAGTSLPASLSSALGSVFARPIALPTLPFGLVLQSVKATAAHVAVVATATNVTYR